MAVKIDGIKPPFIPVGGLNGLPTPQPIPASGQNFHEILAEKLGAKKEIKFSAHARARLESRNMNLQPDQIGKLTEVIDRAEQKGAHDSLVLMDKMAFIVNIPNRTVVTAIGEENMQEHIFTNIDSAIIAG